MKDKLTIVGPEPDNPDKKTVKRVNIEALLLMAKYDAQFKNKLMAQREDTIEASKIPFTKSEKLLLSSLSNDKLEETIKQFNIPGIHKKSLPNWKKAAAVILLITAILTTSLECLTNGINPDKFKYLDNTSDATTD